MGMRRARGKEEMERGLEEDIACVCPWSEKGEVERRRVESLVVVS